jgi:hypothetical protein
MISQAYAASVSQMTSSQQPEIGVVATFRVNSQMEVYRDPNQTERVYLEPGDLVDTSFSEYLNTNSTMAQTQGPDYAYKFLMGYKSPDGLVRMAVRSSRNLENSNLKVFVPEASVKKLSLFKEPAVGDEIQIVELNTPCDLCYYTKNLISTSLNNSPDYGNLFSLQLHSIGYSDSPAVKQMINFGKNHFYSVNQKGHRVLRYETFKKVHNHYDKVTYCYRAVKDALKAAHLVSADFGQFSGEAYQARDDLLKEGFVDLLLDLEYGKLIAGNPDLAPLGAILVYEDTRGRIRYFKNKSGHTYKIIMPGHVEIKTAPIGEGGYVSISEQIRPAYGEYEAGGRRLIGVMIKAASNPTNY